MDPFGILVVFVIAWWLAFFVTLPFGIRPIENPEPGHAPGAPARPRVWLKAAIATVAAGVITGAIVGVVDAGWLSLETFAE